MPAITFPLPLRNALAELVIAALEDAVASEALVWIVRPDGPPAPAIATRLEKGHLIDPGGDALLEVHAPYAEAARAHATAGLHAAASYRRGEDDPFVRALRQAVALWNAGLFFEVHEVLEAVWRTEADARRQGLQGLIQLAVAFHHARHGNLRGARTLLHEGRARLESVPAATLAPIDVVGLLGSTGPIEAAFQSPAGVVPGAPPLVAGD